jgi:uncharacterized membrane protein YbhN (UPF0104 family)
MIQNKLMFRYKNPFMYLLISIAVIAVGYFFCGELKKNWDIIYNYKPVIKWPYIAVSFFVTVIAFLTDSLLFHLCIHEYIKKKNISFLTSISIFNMSNIFKYIPGRIWGYIAQVLWFSKQGIPQSKLLYVNFICFASVLFVSIFLGIVYVFCYFPTIASESKIILLVFLILDLSFVFWHTKLINFLIKIIQNFLCNEMQVSYTPRSLLIGMQMIYLVQWCLTGLGGYFLAQGIGLEVSFTNFYAILASMSISWVIGYVSVITPGGLGIREGVMYLMLNNITDIQISFFMPIATRILHFLVELLLGFVGMLLAIKFGVFLKPSVGNEKI